VLRGLPKDLLDEVYNELEPAVREHAVKMTTVEIYDKWGETKVREQRASFYQLCSLYGAQNC
jgi:hypothetical protein